METFYLSETSVNLAGGVMVKVDKPRDMTTYNKLLKIALVLIYHKVPFIDITDGALFYHADYVKPDWAKTKTKTVEIQDHIFYKWERK